MYYYFPLYDTYRVAHTYTYIHTRIAYLWAGLAGEVIEYGGSMRNGCVRISPTEPAH